MATSENKLIASGKMRQLLGALADSRRTLGGADGQLDQIGGRSGC